MEVDKGVGIAVAVATEGAVGVITAASGLFDRIGVGDAAGLAAQPSQNGISATTVTAAASLSRIFALLSKMNQCRAIAAALARFGLE